MKLNPNTVPNLSPLAWTLLLISLAVLLVAGYFVHFHVYFGWEDLFGFYAIYGFIASAGLVILGNILGKIVKRPETYYEGDGEQLHDD